MKRILILFSYPRDKEDSLNYGGFAKTLDKSAGKFGYHAQYSALKMLEFKIVDGKATIYDPINQRDLRNYDLVFFRMWAKEFEAATACAFYLRKYNVPFIDQEAFGTRVFTKLAGYFNMWHANLPIPDTFYGPHSAILAEAKAGKDFKFPLILKTIEGKKGQDNYLVKNLGQLRKILGKNRDLAFLMQKYIPNDGDYRFLVTGNKIGLIIKRVAAAGSHLNNTSAGARAELVKAKQFKPQVMEDALKAAKIRQRQLAGVDVILDKNSGRHYILEVNKVPQIITGAYVEQKIEAFNRFIKDQLAGRKR